MCPDCPGSVEKDQEPSPTRPGSEAPRQQPRLVPVKIRPDVGAMATVSNALSDRTGFARLSFC